MAHAIARRQERRPWDTVRPFRERKVSQQTRKNRTFSPARCELDPKLRISHFASMTQAVARILAEFEQLSEPERRELRHAIVERVPMSEDLTDEDFSALAAASFRALDDVEAARRA